MKIPEKTGESTLFQIPPEKKPEDKKIEKLEQISKECKDFLEKNRKTIKRVVLSGNSYSKEFSKEFANNLKECENLQVVCLIVTSLLKNRSPILMIYSLDEQKKKFQNQSSF